MLEFQSCYFTGFNTPSHLNSGAFIGHVCTFVCSTTVVMDSCNATYLNYISIIFHHLDGTRKFVLVIPCTFKDRVVYELVTQRVLFFINHGIDLFIVEYSDFSTRRVDIFVIIFYCISPLLSLFTSGKQSLWRSLSRHATAIMRTTISDETFV